MRLAKILAISFTTLSLCFGPVWAQQRVIVVGSGSNIPLPLYRAWTAEFNRKNDRIQVRYVPLGTSESIKEISQGIGDFGGGEVPLGEVQTEGTPGLIAIPTFVVAIVPVYNLPGNPALNFSGQLLGEIFLGTVKNWRDPRIAELNPKVELPNLPLSVVHRTPGRGSNYIFSDFLSKTDPQFRVRVGTSPSPPWPVGTEAKRGEDLLAKVASVPGSIGYAEATLARKSGIGYGRVENASGQFVLATPDNIEAACAAMEHAIPDDLLMDMTNPPGIRSYPIVSFTWIYVPTSKGSPVRRDALKQLLKWALSDGQTIAKSEGYVPLPQGILAQARKVVSSLR